MVTGLECRPRATMIPRGDIPLCCTLNQSPFVLLYILFGRDGRIHGNKPLAFIIHLISAWMSEFTTLLVSAAYMLMMSTATYMVTEHARNIVALL